MAFAVTLKVGQSTTAKMVPLEADGVTVVPGATLSAEVWTITDPGISLFTNADGTATITGVGATTGAVTGEASCTGTAADGTSGPFKEPFTVTVEAPVPQIASIGITFTAPTP